MLHHADAAAKRIQARILRLLSEGPPDRSTDKLGAGRPRLRRGTVEELELFLAEVDLCATHGTTIHRMVSRQET